MKMKRLITICLVAALVLGASATTRAGLVDLGHGTPQRIIDIDFTNPAADHGSGIDIPGGNLDLSLLTYSADFWGYSGPDDPDLKDSDRWAYGDRGGGSQNLVYVEGEGLVVDEPIGGVQTRANGYLVVKIDNHDEPDLYKYFYVEWTAEVSGTPSLSPGVYTYFWGDEYDTSGELLLKGGTLLDSGGDRWTDGWELWCIEPNPEFEAWGVNFQFSDATVTLKSLHIETACIPEPATIALLGLGALSLIRRKRRA